MAEVIKNALLGGTALGGVELLTKGKVSSTILAMKDAVSGILSGEHVSPIISKTLPVVGKLAPFALAGNAVYSGYKEIKKSNVWNGVERGLLTYGIPGRVLTSLGLLSVPLSPQILIGGLGMYSAKKLHKAIGESISLLKTSPSYLKGLSKRAWGGVKKIKWTSGTRGTPPLPPPSTTSTTTTTTT